MQTLKQVLRRPSERENLRAIGYTTLSVLGFVIVSFVLRFVVLVIEAPP